MTWFRLAALIAFAFFSSLVSSTRADVFGSKHNLSVSGPGSVKASGEDQVCLFCHTPHSASPTAALWNRRAATAVYTPYSSPTAKGAMGQPTGASLLCLSCHDGTVALGELLSRSAPVAMAGGVTTLPAGSGRLGTDLGDDHPVSIAYSSALVSQRNNELVSPATLIGKVRLDATGQLQCTSCHDPHDNTNPKFLVVPNTASALCTTCHTKPGWAAGSHATSTRSWNGVGASPWPPGSPTTVAANGCSNCHRPHGAPGRNYLVSASTEEGVCYACHSGNVATKNVQPEFAKLSRHSVSASSGIHSPAEPTAVVSMHVECGDCHNPHASSAVPGTPSGAVTGVRGVNMAGAAIPQAGAEHEVCFRCHADSIGRTPTPAITRQIAQGNLRLKFQTSNASFHPIAGPGRSGNVPSLVAPWTTTSILKCSDCHNNNAGPGVGGAGPSGPHGSNFAPILERQYMTTDNTTYSASNYALCFKCHSSTSIMADASFTKHNKHISGVRAPCSVCHDAHGVPAPGTVTSNSRLINFDTAIVRPSSSGVLRFDQTGTNRGSCYLTCHGENHNPYTY